MCLIFLSICFFSSLEAFCGSKGRYFNGSPKSMSSSVMVLGPEKSNSFPLLFVMPTWPMKGKINEISGMGTQHRAGDSESRVELVPLDFLIALGPAIIRMSLDICLATESSSFEHRALYWSDVSSSSEEDD